MSFYLPSEWEGTRLFVDSGVKIISDEKLRLEVNQSRQPMDSLSYRTQAIKNYNEALMITYNFLDQTHKVNKSIEMYFLMIYVYIP